jgi:hypothetical protein
VDFRADALESYQFYDQTWTLILTNVRFGPPFNITLPTLKIIATQFDMRNTSVLDAISEFTLYCQAKDIICSQNRWKFYFRFGMLEQKNQKIWRFDECTGETEW